MELRNVSTTNGIKSHPDFKGDADDPYKLGSYVMFSPWSNPNSNSPGGYGSKNFSDKAIILKSMNGSDAYIDFHTTLANNIFSVSPEATAFNSQRKLLRTSDGRLHMVFESEGEIFYRRTQTDGTTWENSTSVYLSSGNYNNKFPCITGTSSKQFVVWQRYNTSTSKYDTYFTKNTGSGWSAPATIPRLSGLTSTNDPLPVVTYKAQGGNYRLLVCVSGISGSNTGILYQYSDSPNEGSSWYPGSYYYLPSTNSTHKNPSLSMGPTTPASTVTISYDNGSNVYYNTYATSWGTAQNISSGSGTSNNRYSSVEVDGNGGKNFAWQGYSPAVIADVIIHRRDTGPFQMFETGTSAARPSITGHQSS